MKYFLILLLSASSLPLFSQIVTKEENETPDKTEEVKQKPILSKSGTELFFGISPAYTDRTLSVNDGIFAQPLGYREDEAGEWTVGYNVGIRTKVANHLKLEIGAGYASNRASYDYTKSDSVFRYNNTYRHISFPIKLAYTYGEEVSFYGGIGIVPKAFLSMKNETTTLDVNGNEKTVESIEKDKFNFFLIDAVANIGTQVKLNRNYGFYFILEARRQLNNNYDSQSAYIRKPFAFGFNAGIEIYF